MQNNNLNENNNTENLSKELLKNILREYIKWKTYTPKVGIFGDTGVGKSSLCNALFGKDIARVSDVKACTREIQEISLNTENGGIILIDVPGVGEDTERHEEYKELYKKLLPKLDLIVWAIKADDRKYRSSLSVYNEVVKDSAISTIFVITQSDKIEPVREFYQNNEQLGPTQLKNLEIKADEISKTFGIDKNLIVPISTINGYNLDVLIKKIVSILPDEKKVSFTRETNEKYTDEEVKKEAKKSLWGFIKRKFDESVDAIKDTVEELWEENKEKIIKKGIDYVMKKVTKWWQHRKQ